jgi:chromatin remodeling complex protein RSC6
MTTKKIAVKDAPLKKTQIKEAPVVETPVVETPVVEALVVEAPVVEAPVVEVPVAETPVAETGEADNNTVSIKQRIELLIKSRQDHLNEIKKEIIDLKKLQKDYEIELKNALKNKKKKKSTSDNPNRKPSGFASPVVVSDTLYEFLGKYGIKKGDPVARTDVTRFITTYISENKLQNPEFRREIIPDSTLKSIFGEPVELKNKNDKESPLVYTYLQLQKYLSPHFPKKAIAPVA